MRDTSQKMGFPTHILYRWLFDKAFPQLQAQTQYEHLWEDSANRLLPDDCLSIVFTVTASKSIDAGNSISIRSNGLSGFSIAYFPDSAFHNGVIQRVGKPLILYSFFFYLI